MAIKRLISVVSVSLSTAGAWRMGSIHAVNDTGGFVHCSQGKSRVCVGDVWPDLHVPLHIITLIFRIVFKMAKTKVIVYRRGFRIA